VNTTTATRRPSATKITKITKITKTAETLDAFFGLWRHLIPSEGVSLTAGSTLALLLRSGALRLTALAEGEAVSQPAMTGLVSRLQAVGLVARRADPSDGRAVLVELTVAGRALIEDRRARRAAALEGLLDVLDPGERARFDAAIPALRHLVDHAAHAAHDDHDDHDAKESR
jgi:DNA-binding MarR family transcriptional regulator